MATKQITILTPSVTDSLTSIPVSQTHHESHGSGVPTEVSVVVNHVLELVCEADGIPLPSLTWLKDGRPLPSGQIVYGSSETVRCSELLLLR